MMKPEDLITAIKSALPELELHDKRSHAEKRCSLEATQQFCAVAGLGHKEYNGFIFIGNGIGRKDLSRHALPDLSRLCMDGSFDCSDRELISLQGAPAFIGGVFDCSDNNLANLFGGPTMAGMLVDCTNNPLMSLQGLPLWYSRLRYTNLAGIATKLSHDDISEVLTIVPDGRLLVRPKPAPRIAPSALFH